MKRLVLVPLTLVAVLLAGCSDVPHGMVTDKRAPGPLGDKQFQLQINGQQWWTVSASVWTSCKMGMNYPSCAAVPTPMKAPTVKTRPNTPPRKVPAPRTRHRS